MTHDTPLCARISLHSMSILFVFSPSHRTPPLTPLNRPCRRKTWRFPQMSTSANTSSLLTIVSNAPPILSQDSNLPKNVSSFSTQTKKFFFLPGILKSKTEETNLKKNPGCYEIPLHQSVSSQPLFWVDDAYEILNINRCAQIAMLIQ